MSALPTAKMHDKRKQATRKLHLFPTKSYMIPGKGGNFFPFAPTAPPIVV